MPVTAVTSSFIIPIPSNSYTYVSIYLHWCVRLYTPKTHFKETFKRGNDTLRVQNFVTHVYGTVSDPHRSHINLDSMWSLKLLWGLFSWPINIVSVHCREEGCIGKYIPRGPRDFPRTGILHPKALNTDSVKINTTLLMMRKWYLHLVHQPAFGKFQKGCGDNGTIPSLSAGLIMFKFDQEYMARLWKGLWPWRVGPE